MLYLLPTLNLTLALASLGLVALTIILLVDLTLYKGQYLSATVREVMWPVITLVTIGSVVMSLIYSEYFGFIPCSLCWLQRIGIYPQSLMSLLAMRWQDTRSFPIYGIGLSTFGLLVAIYHYIYQLVPKTSEGSPFMPCLADGSNADCAVKIMNVFGFVTFPFLSAATFAFLIVIYLYMLRSRE